MATRKELLTECKRHDWFHMYSDDHGVWLRGTAHAQQIREMHEELGCPHGIGDIRKALHGQVLEKCVEVNPGEYRDPTWKHECITSYKRDDLLTQSEVDEILEWFGEPELTEVE